jgi:1-acyl-sn-glycerol-3-phosphate acyltransferase
VTQANGHAPADWERARRTGPRELSVDVTLRFRAARWLSRAVVRLLFDVRSEGLDRWPPAPFLLVSNHHSGWDPIIVIAVTPARPRITWFGPKEADFSRGFKNRAMAVIGGVIPYNPEKTNLVSAVRAVRRVFAAGGVLGIFAEGRGGYREAELLPFEEGAVAFASASGVPIVPCALVGTSELWFRRRVVFRCGEPIATQRLRGASGRAELERGVREAMEELLPKAEPRLPRRRPLAWIGEIFDGPQDRERHRRARAALRMSR